MDQLQNNITLPPLVSDTKIFKGSEESPLLAPRGVFLIKGKLFVADTAQNRLFIWNKVPTAEFQQPDVIIGQDNFTTGSENKNTIWSTEGSLYWPFQICIENNIMAVADTGNHRIIINKLTF